MEEMRTVWSVPGTDRLLMSKGSAIMLAHFRGEKPSDVEMLEAVRSEDGAWVLPTAETETLDTEEVAV